MKKYILMLAVAAATALVACGNKEAATEETVEPVEEAIEVVEEAIDTVAADTVAADTVAVAEVAE